MASIALTALKLLLAGFGATLVRIIGQLCIPAGTQTVLAPSMFAENGTMPLAFSVYGLLAYTLIAALFLLLRGNLGGSRISQGLRYGLACCVLWTAYLFEPLPHVAPLDRITYPLADSAALLVMGLLLGLLFGKADVARRTARPPLYPALVVAGCFLFGRLLQYWKLDIYSSYASSPMETLLWCCLTGLAIGLTTVWFNRYIPGMRRIPRALTLGLLLFGADLLLFNFFMPLVFDADIPDLLIRTLVDSLSVTTGCLCFRQPQSR